MGRPEIEELHPAGQEVLLAGRPHTTCGGRPLNDDIVDILYTLLVGGVDGPPISDKINQGTRPATRSFPYLCRPSPEPPDLKGVLARASVPPKEAAAS